MSRRDFTERDIHMALDNELPEEERADFDAWLDANPEMKARSLRFEADRTRLRDSFAGILDERTPDRLARLVTGEAGKPAVGAPRWRMAAAAALLLALGAGGGYLAGVGVLGLEAQAEDELAEEAIAAHTIYAAEQRHAVEVGADDKDHLLGWLSKRLGLTLIAPDLSEEGFELVG
nr:anti-sigma factor [Pseudomonadota bacterium]